MNDSSQAHVSKDRRYSPASDTDTESLQNAHDDSPAFDDPEIDESAVRVLPGTGGPDDEGDIVMPDKP
jgi:hypothetical protein